MTYKLKVNDKECIVTYSINRYYTGKNETVEHILTFGRLQFKGKSLDDVISKLRRKLK